MSSLMTPPIYIFYRYKKKRITLSKSMESKPMLCHKMDKKIWTINNDGLFSVKSYSKIIGQLLYGGTKPF